MLFDNKSEVDQILERGAQNWEGIVKKSLKVSRPLKDPMEKVDHKPTFTESSLPYRPPSKAGSDPDVDLVAVTSCQGWSAGTGLAEGLFPKGRLSYQKQSSVV